MPAPTKPSGKIVAAIGATKESARRQIDAVGPTDCLAVPAPGEVLTWDGSQWVPAPGAGVAGINELDQDVLAGPGSGKQSATVVALQNYALSASAPANGEALVWNGVASEWQPTALPVPVTDVTASSPLSSSGGSTPDISLDAGTTAGDVLTWDGANWAGATPTDTGITELTGDVTAGPGDGSQAATVAKIQGSAVSATAPADGEALVWSAGTSEWTPTALPVPVTDVTASAPLSSSGGATPDISLDAGTASGDVLTWDGSVWAGATPPVPVTDVTASSPLSSSGGTTPDISIDSGGAAGEVLTWDGAAWVSAAPVDTGLTELTQDVLAGPGSGSQIATVVGLQTRPVSNAAPNVGDVLTWDGTQWVPMSTFTSANFDAFGRLRASEPQTIFDSKLVYDAQPLYWAESQTPIGPGAPPAGDWLGSDARVRLTVNGVNQTSIRQSRRYFSYQPGKSQLIFVTYNLNGAVAGATKRVGYFDASNGILLELTGAGASLVRRSGSSTASDTQPQASWNLDTMDGTGPSGVNLQFDKTAILIIDFEWLGVGSIRVGFVVNGQIIYAHRFDSANLNAAVYMSTPNLPVRYEISTTGAFAGSTYVDCICSSVNSEGGLQAAGTQYSYVMPALTTNVPGGTTRTLLSIRHNAAYSRVTVIPINVSPCSDSNGVNSWELVYNPTLAGATWATLNQGYLDIDIAGTATGGTILEAGTFTDAVGAQNLNLRDTTLTLGADVAGVSDVISLRVKNLSGNNHTFVASLAWIAVT